MNAEIIAEAIGVRKVSRGWTAQCPSHDDHLWGNHPRHEIAVIIFGREALPLRYQPLRIVPRYTATGAPATGSSAMVSGRNAKTRTGAAIFLTVVVSVIELVAHLIPNDPADANATWLGHSPQPRGRDRRGRRHLWGWRP